MAFPIYKGMPHSIHFNFLGDLIFNENDFANKFERLTKKL